MNQNLVKHMIENHFGPFEILCAMLISEHSPITHKSIELYLQRYPMGTAPVQNLIAWGVAEVYPGDEPTVLNARLVAKFSNKKSDLFEMAEELWNAYPAAFPLGGGGMFIARKGTDKHEILKLYLERIDNSREKHEFVLEQLKVYVRLVLNQKINGHRIHDWISNEMWDMIPSLDLASQGNFKTDI
jgi:hypothetical protein